MDGRLAPGAPTRWAWRIALGTHVALIAGLPLVAGVGLGLALGVPLLAALPGLWRGRAYTFGWCSMLIVFYVGGLVVAAKTTPATYPQWLALSITGAAEFVALVLYVRFLRVDRLRAEAAQAKT